MTDYLHENKFKKLRIDDQGRLIIEFKVKFKMVDFKVRFKTKEETLMEELAATTEMGKILYG